MAEAAQTHSVPARIFRCALVIAIGIAAARGIVPMLDALGFHDWSKRTFGPNGFYELYIACAFVLMLVSTMALWRSGLARALDELAIARLSPRGCLVCLVAIAAGFAVLLAAGAKYTSQPLGPLLVFGVIGPFVEETQFRGFLFRQMRRWGGAPFWPAAILASLAFGAVHFYAGHSLANALMNSAITFTGGMVFCWLMERWNSIWPGFIIHAGLNLVWSWFALGNNAVGGETGNVARLATIAVTIGLTLIFAPRRQREAPLLMV
ncbi:MAG: lysostaphin resistance A-like protein [Rhizomicrobium sp.]